MITDHINKNCEVGAPAFELVAGDQYGWHRDLSLADEGAIGGI